MNAPANIKYFDNRSLLSTLGPLNEYLSDPNIYELRVNRFGQLVCATTKGRVLHDAPFLTRSYLEKLTNTLLNANGLPRRPVNDVLLPDGSRGVICWPPAVLEGTVLIAIRKHLAVDKSLEELDAEGRFKKLQIRTFADSLKLTPFEEEMIALRDSGDYVRFLKQSITCKFNIAIAGATGSGKSTFTRTLLKYVPRSERVLILEDTHEVGSDDHDEIGYLVYGEQEGRLSARECLKTTMRLSPDRIFLTELRDDAAWDYIKSANTGHPGGIFSTHSNSAAETPGRIADLVKSSEVGRMLDYKMILRTIHATLDLIIYMKDWDVVELLYDPLFKKQNAAR
ncbi:ATPase, T2SS/T4P/T4SS family [Paraburkholderia azotifigens]|uniref:Pilus assembly protein CpaF n=1 Tax=Paraburkholderia azotifigens TaxID=2057004 RepID=A0A5C6VL05_9BURK|nr:ATPase, T2SS/T4P/T4SS family [Paraburkholderia azotifigens]TXC85491.1 pilus assembly protein CpaF [Paraburkholderia azotifigens]